METKIIFMDLEKKTPGFSLKKVKGNPFMEFTLDVNNSSTTCIFFLIVKATFYFRKAYFCALNNLA